LPVISAPQVLHIVLAGCGGACGTGVGCGVGSGVCIGCGVGVIAGCTSGAGTGSCVRFCGVCCVDSVGFGVVTGDGEDTCVVVSVCGIVVLVYGISIKSGVSCVSAIQTGFGDGSGLGVSTTSSTSSKCSESSDTTSSCKTGSVVNCSSLQPDNSKTTKLIISSMAKLFIMALVSLRFL